KRVLPLWTVSLPVLFPGAFRLVAARDLRTGAVVVAIVASVLAGSFDSTVPRPFPLYLLLLSRRVLQGLLVPSAQLRRGRAAQDIFGRAHPTARSPECTSLLHVRRPSVPRGAELRRVEGAVVSGGRRRHQVRHRRRHHPAGGERDVPELLYARLP